MPHPIEFYFDFSSPYGYAASRKIEDIATAHGRELVWRPFLLGAVFKVTGGKPLVDVPMKSDYAKRDFARSAAFFGMPYRQPSKFPANGLLSSRIFYWLEGQDREKAAAFAKATYHAYFVDDQDITEPSAMQPILSKLVADPAAALGGSQDVAIKDRLRVVNEEAIARGVFGSPFFFIDQEPFWGADRLPMIEVWLAKGGWRY